MKSFILLKNILEFNYNMFLSKYEKALEYIYRAVCVDLEPYKKVIDYDKKIANIIEGLIKSKKLKFENIDISNLETKILVLNTEIYDNGGHTECVLRLIKTFYQEYDFYFYLTNIFKHFEKCAPIKSAKIKKLVKEYFQSSMNLNFVEKIFELYNYILDKKITTIYVNIHMQDVVGCAVLYLVKKYTTINVIFFNHADHYYSLGTTFANKILTRCKNGKAITQYLKNNKKTLSVPFLINKEEINEKISNELIQNLGLPENSFVSLTGCTLNKLGDDYFKLIKELLNSNPNFYHILVTEDNEEERNRIIRTYNFDKKRFLIRDFTSYFDAYINFADIYIDSFPQGSALTFVDCMKLKTPVIVKKNIKEPIKSFEEYFYQDYEMVCNTEDEMFNKINQIYNDKNLYEKIQNKIFDYFNKIYSIEVVKPLYRELIK